MIVRGPLGPSPHPPPIPSAPMQLAALLQHVDTLEVRGPVDLDVDHVTRDSRQVRHGSVFVAVVGSRVDGHAFVRDVGARVVVVERDVEARPDQTVVRVTDTKVALAGLAAALYGFPGAAMAVIGVTGTNGKTTVTTLIDGALRALGWRTGRIGTTGNALDGELRPTSFTTPEAPELQALLAELRDAGARAVAMEVSSIGLAQHRVDGIPFAVAVFTNLTQDHLDYHGTMDAYGAAKARLFRDLLRPVGGAPRAVLCGDDPAHPRMGAPTDAWRYGFGEHNDVRIADARVDSDGTALTLATPDGWVSITSAQVGRHNALNLAAAWAALRCLGVDPIDAANVVGSAPGPAGRLERVPDPAGRLVVVDYAHSDDALDNVLRALRPLTSGALWVVFGCGGDRDRGKRPRMGAVAVRLADQVVVTSDNPRSEDPEAIVADVLAGIQDRARVHVEVDREAAIRWALARTGPGDTVLVAGKGHETYQEVAGERRPFDDREVARRALGGA